MQSRLLHATFTGCLLCFALLSGCKGKGEDPDPGAVFRVNGAVTDSFVEVSPEEQRITLDVYLSSGSWKWYLVGNPPEWIRQIKKKEHCMLTEKTVGLIRQILEMDSEVTETEKEQIMKACKMRPQRKLVSAKVAMQTL